MPGVYHRAEDDHVVSAGDDPRDVAGEPVWCGRQARQAIGVSPGHSVKLALSLPREGGGQIGLPPAQDVDPELAAGAQDGEQFQPWSSETSTIGGWSESETK